MKILIQYEMEVVSKSLCIRFGHNYRIDLDKSIGQELKKIQKKKNEESGFKTNRRKH